jgi:hypothetical protein
LQRCTPKKASSASLVAAALVDGGILLILAPQVRGVPLNRLLLESDSPDGALHLSPAWLEALPALADVPQQLQAADLQHLNRPCVLRWTLRLVATALEKPEEDVAAATCANARRVFCSFHCSDPGCDGGSQPFQA